jgi:hypothetical protein
MRINDLSGTWLANEERRSAGAGVGVGAAVESTGRGAAAYSAIVVGSARRCLSNKAGKTAVVKL